MSEDKKIFGDGKVISVNIEQEMKKSFLDYAMSVIVDRALPDVRDGLKPVHRRILYAMNQLGFFSDKPYRKCATTVGEVLGKYHPHGNEAIYESMVRMAQDFSLRYPLVQGHGNFGSIDGDPPAAMRYTEARLAKISSEMLSDINKDTIDFKSNYDDHELEPVVLPSRFPNLLVNGVSGIAVAMATNIPPHNLTEVINGVIKVIDNKDTTLSELMEIIKGPDFPTAGIIIGKSGVRETYETGRGKIVVRAKTDIEMMSNNRQRIVVTELPYQVNKARLLERIAELVKEKRIVGISDIRDESDREGMRVVLELKKDANANIVLNKLFKETQMQDNFNANMVALVPVGENGFQPQTLSLKEIIDYYIEHQIQVITRRTKFELRKAEARAHILEGLRIAIDNLDEVIKIIKESTNEAEAKQNLVIKFNLSDKQAQAVVDMRLGRLTGLEREKLEKELNDILNKIEYYKKVLANESMILDIIKSELIAIRDKFGDERKTDIIQDETEFNIKDLIKEEDNVITLTHFGYIKRLPVDTYKSQKRGGKGIIGLNTREDDIVEKIFIASTHSYIMFFTNKGKVYGLKAYEIPESSRQAKGVAIINLLQLDSDEQITAVIPANEYDPNKYLIMATKKGIVKRTQLSEYKNIRKGGLISVILRDDDELIATRISDGKKNIMLVTREGKAIEFKEEDVKVCGRVSMGVKGIKLSPNDNCISMLLIDDDETLLIVSENGFGKRTNICEYKLQNRGGVGVNTYKITEKTGKLVSAKIVKDDEDIMMISSDGTVIRINAKDVNTQGRTTQGTILMRMENDVTVVSVAIAEQNEDNN